MPNHYTETNTTNSSDSYSSVPKQNCLPQTWTGTGSGAQIKMYNVHDFNQQQQVVNAQITATETTTQPESWNWSSTGDSSDPWTWGTTSETNQWANESDQYSNADAANGTRQQHAGMFNPQTYFNQDASWDSQSWQNDNYYQSYSQNVDQSNQHQQQPQLPQPQLPQPQLPQPQLPQPQLPQPQLPQPQLQHQQLPQHQIQQQQALQQQLPPQQTLQQHLPQHQAQHEEQIKQQVKLQEPPLQHHQPLMQNQIYKPPTIPTTNNNNNEKNLNLPVMSLAAQSSHLFQRSDSWLSSSSLLTINDSLSTSQDTLDASHFMPAETLEEIRKQVAEMEIKDRQDADTNVTNQEIPVEVSTEADDDKIRQPPEGAANKSPVGIIAIPPSGINMQRPAAATATAVPTTPGDATNDETLCPDNANSNEPATYRFSVQPGFSPREDSPFKPPPKSASSIPAVIQQERLSENIEKSILPEDDDGANLETMPDNSEQPIDVSLASIDQPKVSESPSVPASASLWNDSVVKQQTVFLAPPSIASPMQKQNVLIVPRLDEQQVLLNSPLTVTSVGSQGGGHENIENVSQIVDMNKGKVAKPLEMPAENKNDKALTENASPKVPTEEFPPKIPVEEFRSEANRGQRPPIPGFGPAQVPRTMSEDVSRSSAQKKMETPNYFPRKSLEGDKQGNNHRPSNEAVENQRERGPDVRQQRDDRRNYFPQRSDSRQGQEYVDDHADDRRREIPDDRRKEYPDDRRKNFPEHPDRRREYGGYPEEYGHPDDSKTYRSRRYDYDDRSRYYDDPYYQERDRSRPSSRPSMEDDREYERGRREMEERPSSRGGFDERDYSERGRRGLDERPSSRSGYESDRENRGNGHGYSRDEYYRRDPRYYRGDSSYMSERERYYQQYYNSYYNYNNYNYGYYDELYRTDPRFKAQVDAQYRDYYAAQYAGYESSSDQRSIQSGRSSVNDDIQHEREKLELQNNSFNQSYSDYSQTNEGYYQDVYSQNAEVVTPAARLTPEKFMQPHVKVQITANGYLVKVLANNPSEGQPASVEINSLQMLIGDNSELEELKKFPGPLVRGETHKNDVIQFCKEKITIAEKDMELIDKSSYILIWELLILLIRQNGTVVGTDIAELLLKDADKAESPNELTPPDAFSNSELTSPDEGIVVSDRSVISHFSEETITRKFRECLLSGRKKEALEKAMKNGLWGHALFLASKMDNRTYANVMTRFANSLALNDPLQTLYQLMSGRQPAAVTCIVEEKWGDWRPHLAMILSNPTQKPNLDRKSITAMGDTLATRGLLHASQFCYLMAQMDFGTFASKSSKLVLLSANHGLPFAQFATNEAIQCTEVYEFAQQLASPNFIIPTFQTYRFIYATRLAEFGMPQECLRYCEVLSESISQFPSIFQPDLAAQIYELADKLKFYDQSYNEVDDSMEAGDPAWLIKLKNIINTFTSDGVPQTIEETPYNYASESSNASECGDLPVQQQQQQQQQQIQQQPFYPSAFSQNTTNKGFYDPSMTLSENSPSYIAHQQNQQMQYVQQDISNEPNQFSYPDPGQGYQQDYSTSPGDMYSYYPTDPNASVSDNSGYKTNDASASTGQFADYWDISTKKGTSLPCKNSVRLRKVTVADKPPHLLSRRRHSTPRATPVDRKSAGKFRYSPPPPRRSSTATPPSSPNKPTTDVNAAQSKIAKAKNLQEPKHKPPSGSGANSGSSWLGGIFSKLMPKPKNQMKLPDDRNPSIIWDPVGKKWINTEAEEDETINAPAAPPKDEEIPGRRQSIPTQNETSSLNSPLITSNSLPPPSAGSDFNRFRRQGTQKRYVDVVGTDTKFKAQNSNLPSNLFLEQAASNQTAPQLFIPSAVPVSNNSTGGQSEFASYSQQVPATGSLTQPLVEDDGDLSRSSSQGSLGREVQHYMAPQIQMTEAPPPTVQQPLLFNPNLVPTASAPTRGQRRYPR